MASNEEDKTLPPRVQAAFRFIDHVHWVTRQDDVSVPSRPLTALEKSVEAAALRTLQAYLLGEMDYGDAPAARPADPGDEPGAESRAPLPV